ncbi:MAG TPA: DUF4142 domain-containing protein [Chitinophagaceae bacterium]|nr:DUF4142 domain-containing protein [Chitinophagaceae bacterium]
MKRQKPFFTAITVAAICAFACAVPAAAQPTSKLSDAEIASIAVVANQVDIDAAQFARQKSKDATVADFAKTMISDHQSVIDKATALVKKLGVRPQDNAVSRQLQQNAQKTLQRLKSKSGTAFNQAYIANEVAYHQAVIATVEDRLIPKATNADLKALLQSVVPVLRAHLEHAQMVQKTVAAK